MAQLEFTPARDYEGLLKQASAMTMLIRSMEKQQAFQNVKIGDMARELAVQGFEEINAQRDMNEKLTNEISRLEKRIEALEYSLSVSMCVHEDAEYMTGRERDELAMKTLRLNT
jgi:uncharacterized membrane protein YccC